MATGAETTVRINVSGAAKFTWVLSLITSIIGGLIGVAGFVFANGAPQEAAAAAGGLVIVVAPYAFTRAVDALTK
jgi:hypothetical protein